LSFIVCLSLSVLHCLSFIVCLTLSVLHFLSYIVCLSLSVLHCLSYIVCLTLSVFHCLSYIVCLSLSVFHCLSFIDWWDLITFFFGIFKLIVITVFLAWYQTYYFYFKEIDKLISSFDWCVAAYDHLLIYIQSFHSTVIFVGKIERKQ
jgi:hypothetical protein